jgi:hypothetical protein
MSRLANLTQALFATLSDIAHRISGVVPKAEF